MRAGEFQLSVDQRAALEGFRGFLGETDAHVFVLSGPAGTGKSTLLRSMIDAVESRRVRWQLTAMTGRAASIARTRSGFEASTLHSFLYRFDSKASKIIDGEPRLVFSLRDPVRDGTAVLFIDEASMLGRVGQSDAEPIRFGSGVLADDLLRFLFDRRVPKPALAKLVMVGDPFQLPPVGESNSIAFDEVAWSSMMHEVLGWRPPVTRMALSTVHRQARGGSILELATQYRDSLESRDYRTTPRYPSGDSEVMILGSEAAFTGLPSQIAAAPEHHALITHTNEAALAWNRLARQKRWGTDDAPLRIGDILLNTRPNPRTGLENGEVLVAEDVSSDLVSVAHLGRTVVLRRVGVRRVDDDVVHDSLLVETALEDPDRGLDRVGQQVLWVDFRERHPRLRESSPEFWELAFRDPVLNPIVAKYGYAMTCHKAQGGQWPKVIVDFASYARAHDAEEAFRWSYTAVTRAREELVLVDPPRRSPFSRLGSTSPSLESDAISVTPELEMKQRPRDRRGRAEAAVEVWSAANGIELERTRDADYSVRFRAARELELTEYEVYFKGDGDVSGVLPVRTGPSESGLIPPASFLRRAAFDGAPRPADKRIDVALTTVEQGFRQAGLEVTLRTARDWSIELEVGAGADSGILLLDYRKTGVFSSSRWRLKPSSDIEARVAHCLETVANA